MSVLQNIKNGRNSARKEKNKDVYNLLTTLLSECEIVGKNDGNRLTTDSECYSVVEKFIKNNTETMKTIGSNDARYDELSYENIILKEFLPKQLTESELEEVICEFVSNYPSNANIGSIMMFLKTNYPNRYDGKKASSFIKEIL